MNLSEILHRTFGFPAFRANQEAVCRAATEGRDVLLVMPTGAGKSLCYQLPALARQAAGAQSAALVVSPLIALMDDQAAKLTALGLKVARIHSGLSREDARQACRDYLDGTLNFLFIAPERMRVPGFPEMLAKKKPSLIAIDEAHCISAWGHDFRPDYRTLGDHLPSLRPAPIIALTATATPTVQKDIVAQLNLHQPSLFIHGFRRDNLAIEVVEMSKPRRPEFTVQLLADKANRPAIVYAPSRKAAEELAALLGRGAAPYHAGLDPATRDRVQTSFIQGRLEIVVATIAFGMGIDKADVRTVIHVALPGSVEAYYQEIGRAGRDGLPSRTILLHSFVDRKMHDFFLERDYPPPTELIRVAKLLTEDFQMPDLLRQRLKMDAESFDNAIQKLASQGAAVEDIEGNVRGTGSTTWRASYDTQVAFRRSQIDRIVQFAESNHCRMTALIRHFGDTADGTRPCGHCDICNPSAATAQSFRQPNTEDLRQLSAILRALEGTSRSTGKLHTELAERALRNTEAAKDRKVFDTLLDALVRAGLITLATDSFTNQEGTAVSYKKAAITHEGHEAATTGDLPIQDLQIRDPQPKAATKSRDRDRSKSAKSASSSAAPSKSERRATREQATAALTPTQQALELSLRAWRKAEAAKTGKPAFIVFSDAVLRNLAQAAPTALSALQQVSGIGPEKADRYGAALCALCRNETPDTGEYGAPALVKPITRVHSVATAAITAITPSRRQTPIRSVEETRQNFRIAAEDLKRPSRTRAEAYDASANRRLDFEADLRIFADAQQELLKQPASRLLSEAAIAEILRLRPKTLTELERLDNLRGDLPDSFTKALLAVCLDEYKPQGEQVKGPRPKLNAVDTVAVRNPAKVNSLVNPIIRSEAQPIQQAAFTPDQQALETRLRDWRKSESERLGLPQFFVLSSSSLYSIVMLRPQTIAQLQTIPGIGPEKAAKFGPTILQACM